MGVPKFYRWISERYPCLSQIIQEQQIPGFDNLYLDMNGIIHPCSHPNDDDPHFRKSEEEVFEDIFHYIEVLFRIIKPKQVFFMAVDGVAPRAKMNQQRGRRFRSAKEAEDNIRKALEKGQVLPEEERFDSNCITPGTPFMVRLHEQLKFFVSYKISTDPAWQGLRVYLSGHETPGEGEHKIMEFIRSEKVRPDYDPNTRHCLYGLDADLIMLGLSSHEPHFSLLREEVRFGKAAKRITKPEKTTFHLLHLSLLREYLDWEFSGVKDKLSFPYDLERIIDDWILMGFLVGNDFIPHLPNLHINHDALPYLYKLYIDVLPSLDGYLHDSGELILPRFEKYLTALSKFDREQFEEKFVDMKWFESKMGFKLGDGPPAMHAEEDHLALENSFATLEGISEDPTISSSVKHKGKMNPELEKLAARFDEELGDDNDESDEDTFEIEFAMFKRDYYMQKLGYKDIDNDVMAEQTLQYVTGIQWILSYYFSGVPSWSWFYPFHYAPYMSDIRNFSEVNISFDLGTPFLPFEQLLAVLPAASRQLLPQPLQNLMIMEQSPIIEYYPVNFKTDLNGKQQEWEAVVLIPFIDERRLLEAMTPLYSRLTDEEIARNRHGPCLLCTYNPSLNFVCRSSLPGRFPDISCCHAMCEELSRDVFLVDIKHMHRGLSDGVKLDVYYPGFPTLYHVAHKAELKKANVKVFQMHSKNNSMILQISEPQEKTEPLRVAEEWLGETCYVGWPHMVEALVVGVCDGVYRYGLQKNTSRITPKETLQELLTKVQIDSWKHQVSSLTEYHMERRGIELGETNVLIEACPIRGKRFVCGVKGLVTVEKEWSPTPSSYPSQLTVKDILVPECDEEHKIHTIEELFPIDSACFMLASPYYGALGEVIEIDIKQSRVRVQLHVPSEPDVSSVINQHQALSLRYLPAHVVAKKLGISPFLLSRITGTFLVKQGSSQDASGGRSKFDIGLNMKFSKQNKEVLGYARRTEEGAWTFSPTAHKTIAEYLHKFPLLFETLAKMSSKDQLYENDLAPQNDGSASLSDVQHWLKTVPAVNLEPVKCGSFSLDEPVVEAIDRAVHQAKALNQKPKTVKVRVRPHLLFRPSEQLGAIPPDSEAWFELFDRVVNVKLNVAVPFGLRGTVIGIHQGDDSTDAMYEVLFDEPFLGGQPLRCSSNKVNLMAASSLINISHGERCEAKKVDVKSPPRSQQYQHDSRTSHRSAFSPNLGASPELAKQNRNLANRSPDVRLDSSGSPGFGRGIPAKSSPHSVQVNSKHSVPAGSHQSQMASSRTVNSEERNFKPPKLQKGPQSQPRNPNDGLSEFADMWKELKLKENSSPDNKGSNTADTNKEDKSVSKSEASNTLAEEGTQALRELLQIKEKQTVDPLKDGKQQHEPQPTRGRQLSLDDLFRSQGSAQAAVVPQPSPHQAPGSLPSFVLLNWCCAVGLRPPNFHYSVTPQGVIAVVEMSNGFKFPGGVCRDRGEAAESASSVALFQLPRIMPSFPSPLHVTAPQPFVGLPQQFAHGGLARPAHPVIPPVFQTLQAKLPRSPPKHETLQQHSPQQRPDLPTTGNLGPSSMLARDSVSLSDKDVAASLNASASPFVPLQVARRNSGTRQPSPAKDESLAPLESPGNVELIEEAEPDHHDQRAASPAHNKPAAVPQETDPLSPPRTEKPAGSLKKTQNSKQRLLAPSFFSKKR